LLHLAKSGRSSAYDVTLFAESYENDHSLPGSGDVPWRLRVFGTMRRHPHDRQRA
jgi:hypothetical protein